MSEDLNLVVESLKLEIHGLKQSLQHSRAELMAIDQCYVQSIRENLQLRKDVILSKDSFPENVPVVAAEIVAEPEKEAEVELDCA